MGERPPKPRAPPPAARAAPLTTPWTRPQLGSGPLLVLLILIANLAAGERVIFIIFKIFSLRFVLVVKGNFSRFHFLETSIYTLRKK